MKKAKKLLCVAIAAVMLMSMPLYASAAYADTSGHWAEELIDKWAGAGVVEASEDGYRPDDPLTRGELAMALYEIFDWDEIAKNDFTDTLKGETEGTWSSYKLYTSLLRANAAGVIKGYEDGSLKPYASITRQEAVTMLCRAFDIEGIEESSNFTDASEISDYAVEYVNAFSKSGYIVGDGNGTGKFRPTGTITRAEILSIFEKMSADYTILSERAKGDIVYKYTDYKVATVDTWDSGDYSNAPTGTKDIMIRLYKPDNATEKTPVLVYIHGGAWISGGYDKQLDEGLLKTCMDNGISVASVGYRLCTEASAPYGTYDIKGCIRYLRANADELGLDADNIGVTGNSAGASYASLIAVTGDEPELEGDVGGNTEYSSAVDYSIIMYGVYDFMHCFQKSDYRINDAYSSNNAFYGTDNVVAWVFGLDDIVDEYPDISVAKIVQVYEAGDTSDPLWEYVERIINMSPAFWVDENDPPAFIYHGTEDPLIPLAEGVDLYAGLSGVGVEAEIRVCAYTGHSFTHPQYMQDTYDWLVEKAVG